MGTPHPSQEPYQQQGYPQQVPGQLPYPGQHEGAPPPVMPYGMPAPYPQEMRTRVTGGAHTVHAVLTVCSCGVWGVVWFLHWLFTRKKTVIR